MNAEKISANILANLEIAVADCERELNILHADLEKALRERDEAVTEREALLREISAMKSAVPTEIVTLQSQCDELRSRVLRSEHDLFSERCHSERISAENQSRENEIKLLTENLIESRLQQNAYESQIGSIMAEVDQHLEKSLTLQHNIKEGALAASTFIHPPASLLTCRANQQEISRLKERISEEVSARRQVEAVLRDKEAELQRLREETYELRILLLNQETSLRSPSRTKEEKAMIAYPNFIQLSSPL